MDLGLESTIVMNAVKMIRRKGFEPSEDSLLEVIANPRYPLEVYWATIGLREWGTSKSIPVLKELTNYPKQDVKMTSVSAIGEIAGSSETQFFCDLLASPSYKEKGTAMWAIAEWADDSALPSVLAYFEKNRSKLRSIKLTNWICMDAAIYLIWLSPRHMVAKEFLYANIGLLLDNTDQMQQRGWGLIRGRPKNEWVEELFALANRPLPTWVTPKPAWRTAQS